MPDRTATLRKAYAERILRLAGVSDARLEAAFAAVPREDFCGPPPWRVSGGLFGLADVGRDPARLYDDVLVVIDAARGINNGQPSLHAQSLAALRVGEGETVVQIGAGAGYYTAILARLVGPKGRVVAYEIEPDIAGHARDNLAGVPEAEVRAGSGAEGGLPKADAIYVSCAATHPARAWLEALNPGGRLLFPLQAEGGSGSMLLVTRPERESRVWPARLIGRVVFIACAGVQDPETGRRLEAAFARGGAERVSGLTFGAAAPETVWLQGDGFALTMGPPPKARPRDAPIRRQ